MQKSSQKLNAFARMAYSLKFEQRKLLLNAFITSQFSYAPILWMFHNRKLNSHINRIHERALRTAYQDHNSTFNELFTDVIMFLYFILFYYFFFSIFYMYIYFNFMLFYFIYFFSFKSHFKIDLN